MELPTVPNTARMIDYWLGGSHYFPVDLEGVKLFEQGYPHFREVFQNLRDYTGRVSRYIESQGINQFIVFGSGLPTCGNVHEVVPQSKVLYTDIDSDNIKLGREILADNPNSKYTFCDATNLDSLEQSEVNQALGSLRRLGLIFVGVAAFIPDEILTAVLDKLYDWAPAGSFLALDFDGEVGLQYPQLLEFLDSMGAHLYLRNPTTIKPLLGRWQLTKPGILPVSLWEAELSAQPQVNHEAVFMYGCVVYK